MNDYIVGVSDTYAGKGKIFFIIPYGDLRQWGNSQRSKQGEHVPHNMQGIIVDYVLADNGFFPQIHGVVIYKPDRRPASKGSSYNGPVGWVGGKGNIVTFPKRGEH